MLRNKGLNEKELATLAALGAVGVTSVTALADAASLKMPTVRYALQSLLERRLISPFCSIDPAAVGFRSYIVYISLSPGASSSVESALQALASHQNVSWVGELSGAFQYGCTICARDTFHFMSLLERIAVDMGVRWERKSVTERTHLTFWPLKFFSENPETSLSISHSSHPVRHEIDLLDHTVLKLKSEDPTLSNSEIARLSKSPVSTIVHRVEQLSKKKILLGSWYAPNWNNLGIGHSEVSLVLRDVSSSLIEELVRLGGRTRSCHYVVAGAGSWDFQFNILSSHPTELQRFTRELWETFGSRIETINVSAYTRLLKYSTYPFQKLHGAP
jgi:DNA-binding Lrp family transcriptional regulator